ncbi:hypothetical protein ABT404_28680 [Streptomyces hyaluromycini]|uniref:Uncharacterized protein n=1 Tax=Streptomyces hyaluromycini TaxID=1377993 RepID=A0ABV1X304_9ACTN
MAVFAKSTVPQFAVDIYQNEYLPEGGREVNAIVTVTATGGGTLGGRPSETPSLAWAPLIQQPDSTWSLIDKGSTNGTTVSDSGQRSPSTGTAPPWRLQAPRARSDPEPSRGGVS